MLGLIVIAVWAFCLLGCAMSAADWLLGNRYHPYSGRRIRPGIATLVYLAILVAMYYTPWSKLGVI